MQSPRNPFQRIKIKHDCHAFTLIELLTVIAILGVLVSVTHIVFMTNWMANHDRIARADLWQEANTIMEYVSLDGRQSRTIAVTPSAGVNTAVLTDKDGGTLAAYVMNSKGEFQMSRGGGSFKTLSTHLDFVNSSFSNNGKALSLHLVLTDRIWNRIINVDTSTEVYPRNPSIGL